MCRPPRATTRCASPACAGGKGGVVWHTQGSGKSITMTCFAARVMQEPAMQNPTIVVITDRNDLDGQLFGVFSLAQDLLREQPAQANTRQQLRALLSNRPSGGIVFATIRKFMPGEDEDAYPLLSERSNIVVIADEAASDAVRFRDEAQEREALSARCRDDGADHRQRRAAGAPGRVRAGAGALPGRLAQHLRDALPKATFVAFTGTPASGEDRDTRAVFGDYISVHDMQQAKEDGAAVAILRRNLSVDWSARESVQAKLRLMVKRILRKYKCPPDQQDAAVELVLQQARALGEAWA